MVAAGSAAATLGLENQTIGIQQADEIAPAFETFKGRAETLYVATSPLLGASTPQSMRMMVDLPLPLGPSKP